LSRATTAALVGFTGRDGEQARTCPFQTTTTAVRRHLLLGQGAMGARSLAGELWTEQVGQ
jgi:hypothetical protein